MYTYSIFNIQIMHVHCFLNLHIITIVYFLHIKNYLKKIHINIFSKFAMKIQEYKIMI